MLIDKKYAVYYRTIPVSLELFIVNDKHMKYVKDGLKVFEDGHKCPRLSIMISPSGNHDDDKKRLKAFEQLLDSLCNNNQLVGYSG